MLGVLGRFPGGGHGNPLQYSCLENPMGRETWWATDCGVTELDLAEWLSTAHIMVISYYVNEVTPGGPWIVSGWGLVIRKTCV